MSGEKRTTKGTPQPAPSLAARGDMRSDTLRSDQSTAALGAAMVTAGFAGAPPGGGGGGGGAAATGGGVNVDANNPLVNTHALAELSSLKNVFTSVISPLTALSHGSLFIERSAMMNALGSLHGAKVLRVLQPTLGVDYADYKYDLSDQLDSSFARFHRDDDSHATIKRLNAFYNQIHEACLNGRHPYIVDGSEIFRGDSRMFADFRHPNAVGYAKIARFLADRLEEL